MASYVSPTVLEHPRPASEKLELDHAARILHNQVRVREKGINLLSRRVIMKRKKEQREGINRATFGLAERALGREERTG